MFKVKNLLVIALISILSGCAENEKIVEQLQKSATKVLSKNDLSVLSTSDITAGLKEALNKGTGNVVSQLGQKGGFSSDPLIRIPLPNSLLKAKDFATKLGLSSYFVDLEDRLNQAAEVATPLAKDLFVGAIKDMKVSDAEGILKGPDNAATVYFQDKTSEELKLKMRPIVDQSLEQVGAIRSLNSLLDAYEKLPFAPEINADLTQHVVSGGTKGIFRYVAEEEKAIRNDPLKRTSELLKRVFTDQQKRIVNN